MSRDDSVRVPFDPEKDALFCARCGRKLEASGHMFSEFMMCPAHGEFTIAPVVIREPLHVVGGPPHFHMVDNPSPDAGRWFLLMDRTTAGMWSNCEAIDARHKDGSPYDPRETRVL